VVVHIINIHKKPAKHLQLPFWLPSGSENQFPLLYGTTFSIWLMIFQELISYGTFPLNVIPDTGSLASFHQNQPLAFF
jgi:hypothetical protein